MKIICDRLRTALLVVVTGGRITSRILALRQTLQNYASVADVQETVGAAAGV